ncbi:hypothetical protein EDB85DRAFT_2145022 [Lactarius pseudohatsudake]|nr:hypothetical protein EDB85DRAFT_2145022 [Lactarius pseudohatsudake]
MAEATEDDHGGGDDGDDQDGGGVGDSGSDEGGGREGDCSNTKPLTNPSTQEPVPNPSKPVPARTDTPVPRCVEAIVAAEDEEETDEGEILSGLFDDEEMSNDEADVVSRAGLSDIETSIKDLQDDGNENYIPLPFRVPRSTDPSIWVRPGEGCLVEKPMSYSRFAVDVLCRVKSTRQPLRQAFALSSILGYVFIEAFDVREVRHVVKGLVIIRDKQPQFIAPTDTLEYSPTGTIRSAGMEVGQWVWTIAELAQQYGQRKVKVLGPDKFAFRGSVYEDGLVMEHIPSSYLRVLGYSPQNITPFVQSAMDSTQVGDRMLVVSGEYAGIIGRTKRIQDNVADVVTQSPEQHSRLIIRVALRDLIPYFLPGDNKVTFLDREANAEIDTPTLSIQFFSSPLRFFRFTQGLYVEFPGKAVRRTGVAYYKYQTAASPKSLTKSEHRRIWEGKRVMITKGSLKGYHGLVKAEDPNGVDIELDAKVASHGLAKQHFQYGEFQVEPISMPVASPSRLNRTPPPEDVPRAITPESEEPEENTAYSRSWPQGLVRTHWLFAEEIQGVLREECIPFHVQGIPALSPHIGLNGRTAKTVPLVNQKILPKPNEVVVSVVQRRKPIQISIDPSNLVPWTPSEGNKVVIIGHRCTGQVGKLLKLEHECCIIELESSGERTSFMVEDVANVLKI